MKKHAVVPIVCAAAFSLENTKAEKKKVDLALDAHKWRTIIHNCRLINWHISQSAKRHWSLCKASKTLLFRNWSVLQKTWKTAAYLPSLALGNFSLGLILISFKSLIFMFNHEYSQTNHLLSHISLEFLPTMISPNMHEREREVIYNWEPQGLSLRVLSEET